MSHPSDFAKLLNRYFNVYLINQRGSSPQTIISYRQVFAQFLQFMKEKKKKVPSAILMNDFSYDTVSSFLDWLEKEKNCSANTRNHRLAVLRSFASFVEYEYPSHLDECLKILSIQFKKVEQGEITYLKPDAMKLLLEEPDKTTSLGRRDHLMFSLLYSTGIRVSELTGIRVKDISLSEPKSLTIHGKGSKIRYVPLLKNVIPALKAYIKENRLDLPENCNELLFKNRMNSQLTRQGVFYIVQKYVDKARAKNPTMFPDDIGVHTFRHSTAMSLVNSNVDLIYIRDLLGHTSVETTEIYARSDTETKRAAIEKAAKDFVPKEEPSWKKNKDMSDWLSEITGANVM